MAVQTDKIFSSITLNLLKELPIWSYIKMKQCPLADVIFIVTKGPVLVVVIVTVVAVPAVLVTVFLVAVIIVCNTLF